MWLGCDCAHVCDGAVAVLWLCLARDWAVHLLQLLTVAALTVTVLYACCNC